MTFPTSAKSVSQSSQSVLSLAGMKAEPPLSPSITE
jgi:hypothetical protein